MGACSSSASSSIPGPEHSTSQADGRSGSFRRDNSGSLRRDNSKQLPSAPVLLGKSEHRLPPPPLELKLKEGPMEPETLYTEMPLRAQSWELSEDEDEEALPPLPQAQLVGWVARARKEDPRAVDRSRDFLDLLGDVRAGDHALARRWDLLYLLVPGFFHSKYTTYMQRTKNHLTGLGLDCRMAEIDTSRSVKENAASLAEQVEELSVLTSKRVVLVGHSKGGCDATAAVARHAERLRQRVAGVLCLQAPLGGTPVAGELLGRRLRGRVLRTVRYALGGEVEALGDVTYESRRAELEAFPYPHGLAPLVTFSSETSRKGSLLEPLASHARRRYRGLANDGLVASLDAHLECSTMVAFGEEWDHGACAFSAPSLPEKEELVNEALLTLLAQEVPTIAPNVDASLTPIYDFWNRSRREHTFHNGEPWSGECKKHIVFYAFRSQVDGTEAVYSFWNKEYDGHTFHMGKPLDGESQISVQFYAFSGPVEGAEPVFSFWHEENADYTVHMGEPVSGESKKEVLFYAFRFPGVMYNRARSVGKIDRV